MILLLMVFLFVIFAVAFNVRVEASNTDELQVDMKEVEQVLGMKFEDAIKIEKITDAATQIHKIIETDRNAFYPATQNYKALEILLRQGGFFKEVLEILERRYDPKKPQAALLSRIAHAYYETGIQVKSKKEAKELFKKGMEFVQPHLDSAYGTTGEKTYLLYWYALNKLMYFQYKYSLLALFKISSVMKDIDRSINEDPKFPQNYYLKANMYESIPFGKYGDKFLMGKNYATAYGNAKAGKLHIGIAFAKALIKRNWDVNKKLNEAKKRNEKSDGTPMNLSDQEYAVQISQEIIKLYYSRLDVYRADRYGKMCKEAEEIVEKYAR